jgi:hypothetical protein
MVIKRINDCDAIYDNDLDKLAQVVEKQENIKLYELVNSDKEALVKKKELQLLGFQVKIEPLGDKWKVYAIMSDKVKYSEAMESGQFKKLAWGRYSFDRHAALGMFKYDFDDGSIWKVVNSEDGQEYLVKEVDDEDESNIIRIKTASASNAPLVNANNIKNVLAILYDINDVEHNAMVNDLLSSDNQQLTANYMQLLNQKMIELISNKVEQNHFIESSYYTDELHDVIKIAVSNNEINSKERLNTLIDEYTSNLMNKTGKMQKLLD